jgi:hypothetical protein
MTFAGTGEELVHEFRVDVKVAEHLFFTGVGAVTEPTECPPEITAHDQLRIIRSTERA